MHDVDASEFVDITAQWDKKVDHDRPAERSPE